VATLSKKHQRLLFSLVFLVFWVIFVPNDIGMEEAKEIQKPEVSNFEKSRVLRVVDGDTIEIEGGQKVRYIGIDTPETVDPRREPQCFGKAASQANSDLVAEQEIYLEKDVSETDRYGRLLRYIYLATDSASINEQLVRAGYAVASSYPPDVKYQEKFKEAEEEARANQRGLWQEDLICD
jgi:micrococcal nuclease